MLRFVVRTALATTVLLCTACVSYVHVRPVPDQQISYQQGTAIITSERGTSTVMIMPAASSYQKGQRLGFYALVRNDSPDAFDIDITDVSVTSAEGDALPVHTYDSVTAEIRRQAAWAAVAAGLQAVGEGMQAANAGYSSTTTYGTANVYGSSGSAYGTYSGTSTTYDPAKAAAAQAQANRNSQERMGAIATQQNSEMARAELLLRRTTVPPGQSHDATLLIDAPRTAPSIVRVEVTAGGETHQFDLVYEQVAN